jgi:hypothetical protein
MGKPALGGIFGSLGSSDSEPALSAYGIDQAIQLVKKTHNDEEKEFYDPTRFQIPTTLDGNPIPISVSPLIRTWETAILLYGYQNNQSQQYIDLELRICPWLKETGWVGNDPKELNHSIPKFIKFLNNLLTLDFLTKNYRINTIIIYIPPAATPKNSVPSDGMNWQKIEITLHPNRIKYIPPPNICNITDTVYNRYGYQKEKGNIMTFMEWYRKTFGNPHEQPVVHIVAHSNIMKDFVKKELDTELSDDIAQQNCWTITVPYHYQKPDMPRYNEIQSENIINNIKPGFKNPDKYPEELLNGAKNLEREKQSKGSSLCGKYGSVPEEERLKCASGGRRTRRKRNRRKKTRRYRR